MAPKANSPHQLLVEGRDDKHSIIHLMMRNGVDGDNPTLPLPFVRDCQGQPNLLENELPLLFANKSAHRIVGVVLDADEDHERRWAQVTQIFKKHGITCPKSPVEGGFFAELDEGAFRAGIWLMPNNQSPGILEDFLALLVPDGDSCWDYCDIVVDEAKARRAPFADQDRSKAKIHTWLAWRENPGIPFGQALTQKCLSADAHIAQNFVQWFRQLYRL